MAQNIGGKTTDTTTSKKRFRMVSSQQSYNLQGWQKYKVFPDLLACLHTKVDGKYHFSVLETKGDHLKGNDDTEYKRKLFELLANADLSVTSAGELELEDGECSISFSMLMEESWEQALQQQNI